jgi:hypothetical protein
VGTYSSCSACELFLLAERQEANKKEQEQAYQELADSISEEDRRFLQQQNARKRKREVS